MRIMTVAFVVFFGWNLALAAVPSETQEFDAAGLTELEIENGSGQVTIATTDGPKASVVAHKNKFSKKCKITYDRSGDKLGIKMEKAGFFGGDCEVDFEVKVPKTVDIDLKVGQGNVNIAGTTGKLDFKVGSGDVIASGSFRKVEGNSGSGSVEVKGMTGDGELKVGSGKVNLQFSEKPTKGELELKVGSGSALVSFPKGAKIKTNFKSGTGSLTNDLGEDASPDYKVSAKTGTGNLTIKAY